MATMKDVQQAEAWYAAVTADGLKYARYNCDANKSLVFSWIESQQMPVNAASVLAAFQEGTLRLAVLRDEQAEARAAEVREQEAAREQERQRLADVAEQNERFELIQFCAAYRCADATGQAVERKSLDFWETPRLRAYADSIKLQRASKGQSAAEFSKAQGLDKIDVTGREIKRPDQPVSLSADFDARAYHKMSGAQIRLFVKSLVAKHGIGSDRKVWAAINQRVAETRGQGE